MIVEFTLWRRRISQNSEFTSHILQIDRTCFHVLSGDFSYQTYGSYWFFNSLLHM